MVWFHNAEVCVRQARQSQNIGARTMTDKAESIELFIYSKSKQHYFNWRVLIHPKTYWLDLYYTSGVCTGVQGAWFARNYIGPFIGLSPPL